MNDTSTPLLPREHYQLRFAGLYDRGRGFAFPCDAAGHVDLLLLSVRARESYRLAQAAVGTEYAAPIVAAAE